MDRARKRKFITLVACATYGYIKYFYTYVYKERCHVSYQTGEKWMREVLDGHHLRCINTFRMDKHTFLQLCKDLEFKYGVKPSERMSVIEKVGIFVYTLSIGASNRDCQERFQRSGETISRVFHEVLDAIDRLAHDIINPTDREFKEIPPKIANDKRYMPYFKDCIGCIDGTHIAACIPVQEQIAYIGRKGMPSQNVTAVCDFNMCFTFVSVGWEGSAHDTRVFLHATNTEAMHFPHPPIGKYYLMDKGYPDKPGYLVPYPKIRYHQSEFEREPPKNAQEAFNRQHSSLRSCIERTFGVLKKRWKILRVMPDFSVQTQGKIVVASCALHNYIRMNSNDDIVFTILEENPLYVPYANAGDSSTNDENRHERCRVMSGIRNSIADMLWNDRHC